MREVGPLKQLRTSTGARHELLLTLPGVCPIHGVQEGHIIHKFTHGMLVVECFKLLELHHLEETTR